MNHLPESSIVKVLDKNRDAQGAGFLIGKRWILTCRHVVNDVSPNAKIGDEIYLTFYLDEPNKVLKSHIFFWSQNTEYGFAILKLEDEAPSCASIGKLMLTDDFWDRELKVCGFPYGDKAEWVSVLGRGRAYPDFVQIDVSKFIGYNIEGGFSGTPVFDAKLNDIVGIVVYKETATGILSGGFSPIDSILNVCKEHSFDLSIFEFLSEHLAPIVGVPTLPPHYLSRTEDLKKIKELMLADFTKSAAITSAKQINSLQGMGGMGKSVLSTALAQSREARDAFHDGIFWVTVGLENPDLIGGLKLVGREFGDDPANYSSQKEAEASLSKVLSNKTCLIILDDVWKVQDAVPFVNALGKMCKLLITTRNNNVVTSLGAQEHKIKTFSELEALKLLANWYDKDVNLLPSEAKGVARECGYLPLALSMCGAMAKSGISWLDILEALQEADLEFIEAQLPNYPNSNVMKAFKVSLDFLSSEDSDAVKRYQELAIFPTDEPVPEATIAIFWAHTGNLKKRNSGKLISKLKEMSLLRLDGEAPHRFISLHDLQLDYLRATTRDLTSLHNQLLEAYPKDCKNKWSTGPNDGYFFEHLAYHMKEAGRKEELHMLLLNFEWMHTKLEHVTVRNDKTGIKIPNINSLIHDYDYLLDDTEIRLVQSAIKLSYNALIKNETQLAGQLLGRLLSFHEEGIQTLLGQACECQDGIRLLPRTCSLKSPGGSLIRTLDGHDDWVNAVAITRDGKYAISASSDKTLKIWNLQMGEEKTTLKGHDDWVNAVAITRDGKYAISASDDKTLKVWDLEKGEEKTTLKGHDDWVNAVAITRDGKYAISASSDKTLKVWNLERGEEKTTLKGHDDWVNAVAITRDGKYAISASGDKTLKVWDLEKGEEKTTLKGHDDWVNAVAITRDGKYAISASGDKTLKVWDLEKGEEKTTLKGHDDWVNAVAITRDGKYAISASGDKTLKVWNLERGKEKTTLKGHDYRVNAVAITRDGRCAVSASGDKTLKVWDLEKEEEKITLKGHDYRVNAVAITPDGKYAVSASSDKTLKVWNLERGEEKTTLKGHDDWVNAVAITRDGKYAISASGDKTLKVWDLEKGEEKTTLRGHDGRVRGVAITPDGKYAVSVSYDRTLKVWNLERGEEKATLKGYSSKMNAVAITHDGRYAVLASDDKTLKIWDRNREEKKTTLKGHDYRVNAVAITCDGRYAVSASDDKTLKIWNLERGEEKTTLKGHDNWVNAVAITRDGRYAISASSDKTLKVWDLEQGIIISNFTGDSPFLACCISPNGESIVAGDSLGKMHFFSFEKSD